MMKTYGTYDISWKMPNKFNKMRRWRRGEDYKKKRWTNGGEGEKKGGEVMKERVMVRVGQFGEGGGKRDTEKQPQIS